MGLFEVPAQTDQFAYAITDVSKEGTAWKVLRRLDLKTGEYSPVLLDGMSKNSFAFDAEGWNAWQCRVRAFNASGFSGYTDAIEVDLI